MSPGFSFVASLFATSLLAACSGIAASPGEQAEKAPAPAASRGALGHPADTITLDYADEVAGYKVRVYWKPVKVRYSFVVGPAILEFREPRDNTFFTLVDNHFGLPKNTLNFIYNRDSTALRGVQERQLTRIYKNTPLAPASGQLDAVSEPFVFADVDFDQTKELLLKEIDQGQRAVATFRAYKFEDGYNAPEPSEMRTEPFCSLDELSVIDYPNKQLVLEKSGGACASAQDAYALRPTPNGPPHLVLVSIAEGQRDDAAGKCYELKYKVVDGKKQLISKKQVKSWR